MGIWKHKYEYNYDIASVYGAFALLNRPGSELVHGLEGVVPLHPKRKVIMLFSDCING